MAFIDTKDLEAKEPEVWHFVEGQFEVTLQGETHNAGPGCAAVVPPNAPHAVKALTAGRAMVVDYPRRASVGSVTTE
jgi:quercetin dioxygenase-like cupin family protein